MKLERKEIINYKDIAGTHRLTFGVLGGGRGFFFSIYVVELSWL